MVTEIPMDNPMISDFRNDASLQTEKDEPKSTLMDLRETTDSFTDRILYTPISQYSIWTKNYAWKTSGTALRRQKIITQILTNYEWQLRRIGHTSATNEQQLMAEEYNRHDSEFKSWQRRYITSQKKHPNPEDIPPEVVTHNRKKEKVSAIVYHEWKLKLS